MQRQQANGVLSAVKFPADGWGMLVSRKEEVLACLWSVLGATARPGPLFADLGAGGPAAGGRSHWVGLCSPLWTWISTPAEHPIGCRQYRARSLALSSRSKWNARFFLCRFYRMRAHRLRKRRIGCVRQPAALSQRRLPLVTGVRRLCGRINNRCLGGKILSSLSMPTVSVSCKGPALV